MRKIMYFGAAFAIAATAFFVVMLTTPPVSEARTIPTIDTYALTLKSGIATGKGYDCN